MQAGSFANFESGAMIPRRVCDSSARLNCASACKVATSHQCATARRPSSRPAAAKRNAPLQTLHVRRAYLDASLIHKTKGELLVKAAALNPPTTINVSKRLASMELTACVCMTTPELVRIEPPVSER